METVKKLGILFDELADGLNINDSMLEKAESAYTALGNYIKEKNLDWNISIYPQGSFQLGTVIKPLSDDDQYDVDLVVVVNSLDISAKNLRGEILELLKSHGRYEGKIDEKKPCIRIQYADTSQFHMDVACAIPLLDKNDERVEIAKFDGLESYYYDRSNPKGYNNWFKNAMKFEEERKYFARSKGLSDTEVENLKLTKLRTPLQKTVQILKRHRDIYFANKNQDNKVSSIIITTLCARVYEDMIKSTKDEENLYLIISEILSSLDKYIIRDEKGIYHLKNPSMAEEDFLKKWENNEIQVNAFYGWLSKARLDIIQNPKNFLETDQLEFRKYFSESFGEKLVSNSLNNYGERIGKLAKEGKLYYNNKTNSLTINPNDSTYSPHTFFGGNEIE
ncbi:nucleotidyltransferase domain-containing protein [Anaerorhabdus sp.]|uniref:nucleotidyltransferase domain-containing protein n=1 Tax=Anaerorhabdus sp. TaxID=1872524 RepID=UPI002FC772EE